VNSAGINISKNVLPGNTGTTSEKSVPQELLFLIHFQEISK